jgi:ribosomal protein L11 methyltransferase
VAGGALVEVRTEEILDDWDTRWRGFHRPLVLENRLAVRPPWEAPLGTPVEIVIDPGRAFGTGAHATTRLCLEALLEFRPHGSFIDLGCGSGVLAIAASKLGWHPVGALDHDPAAIEATEANAQRNRAEVTARRYDLRTDAVDASVAATVAANLFGPLLVTWCARLGEADQLPERVVASGLLAAEAHPVKAAFAELGLGEAARRASGDWLALVLAR